jgi:hypothetical protein
MTVYKYRKVWRAEVFVEGKRVAAKSGFTSKTSAKSLARQN